MKKLLAILLACIMIVGMTASVVAVEGQDPVETEDSTSTGSEIEESATLYSDDNQVVVKKRFRHVNPGNGSISAAESFNLQQVGDGVVLEGEATTAPDLGTIVAADFERFVSTTEDGGNYLVKNIIINLPTYTRVGRYQYTLEETIPTELTAGVEGTVQLFKLIVTVINDEKSDDLIRVGGAHMEAANQEKSDTFENTYSAGSLSVQKLVTGNLADKEKEFLVNVTFTSDSRKVKEAITYIDGTETKTIEPGAWLPSGSVWGASVQISLTHEETVTFKNIPYGVHYDIMEHDYSTINGGGYDAPSYAYSDQTRAVSTAEERVTITNNKDTEIDTGIILDSLPYVIILAVVALGVVMLVVKRRKAER